MQKWAPFALLGLQEFEAPRIYRKLAQEGGKVFNPTHQPSLLQDVLLVPISIKG
jgi:hypothetical protein